MCLLTDLLVSLSDHFTVHVSSTGVYTKDGELRFPGSDRLVRGEVVDPMERK